MKVPPFGSTLTAGLHNPNNASFAGHSLYWGFHANIVWSVFYILKKKNVEGSAPPGWNIQNLLAWHCPTTDYSLVLRLVSWCFGITKIQSFAVQLCRNLLSSVFCHRCSVTLLSLARIFTPPPPPATPNLISLSLSLFPPTPLQGLR